MSACFSKYIACSREFLRVRLGVEFRKRLRPRRAARGEPDEPLRDAFRLSVPEFAPEIQKELETLLLLRLARAFDDGRNVTQPFGPVEEVRDHLLLHVRELALDHVRHAVPVVPEEHDLLRPLDPPPLGLRAEVAAEGMRVFGRRDVGLDELLGLRVAAVGFGLARNAASHDGHLVLAPAAVALLGGDLVIGRFGPGFGLGRAIRRLLLVSIAFLTLLPLVGLVRPVARPVLLEDKKLRRVLRCLLLGGYRRLGTVELGVDLLARLLEDAPRLDVADRAAEDLEALGALAVVVVRQSFEKMALNSRREPVLGDAETFIEGEKSRP